MTRSYKQLDILERQRIYFLRKQGFSLRKIAEDLSRSPSTISREVKRNSGGRGYRFAQAQRKARQRGTAASSVPPKMTEQMWFIVESKLGLQWSPDQISGRLKLSCSGFGECGVDIPSRVGGQAQRREALQASAAPGEEAQQPRVGVFGQGAYTGQGGHNGASTDS